jgi:hypothetical protein
LCYAEEFNADFIMAQALAASVFLLLLASSTPAFARLIMCERMQLALLALGWDVLCSLTSGGGESASQEALQDEQARDVAGRPPAYKQAAEPSAACHAHAAGQRHRLRRWHNCPLMSSALEAQVGTTIALVVQQTL